MRHKGSWNRRDVGPVRRVLGGILFILFLPVMIIVGLLMLPFIILAGIFGFGPPRHLKGRGCGSRRGGGDDATEAASDVGTTEV
ncbi:MAG: hypothetical protein ACR2N5_08130 [Solirubrobacterales bacterium]